MNQEMIKYRLNRKYDSETIGLNLNEVEQYNLIHDDLTLEFLIQANDKKGIKFNIDVACGLLNEYHTENQKLQKRNQRLNSQVNFLNKVIDALEIGTGRKIEELINQYCNEEAIKNLGLLEK